MGLRYKVTSTKKPGQGKDGEQLWFPRLTSSQQVNLKQMAEILADRSTASRGDVYLIVMGLAQLIPELLADGKTVKLDSLGTFRLQARVDTSPSPDLVSSRHIKEIRAIFRPDNEIKLALKNVNITKEVGN